MKKSNKDRESEILKVYNLYWDSYLKGDLEAFASTMDDAFEMIGTSEFEVCHNKADGIEFYKAQIEEVVGKTEMRNRIISSKPLSDMFLVNETCDVYIFGTPEWTFYSKLRLSTILYETKSGWKIIQQHGSLPDMRVEKGETMAFEKITKENLELRDAVKRRTAELESKSRELAIEAALEKVRAVAMGMKKPEDMLEVCESISDRLKDFGVSGIRNIQTAIIDENNGIYLCYQYFTQYETAAIERTEYLKSPVEEDMVKQMLASKDGHFTGMLTGNELNEFREHRKAEKHFPDPLLDETDEISHCFLSIGQGGLGLTLYQAMEASTMDLFNRFHQVFSLVYQRFQDIQKAEARAREVEIDLALERVRAQTMAMHSSEDVGNCIVKMFSELTSLGVDEGTRFGIGILNHENENNELWTARKDGREVKMHIGNIDMNAHPLLKSARKAWLEQVTFHKYVLEGDDLLEYYRMLNKAPDYKIQIPIEKLPQREVQHCFIFEHGFFYAFSPLEFQPELIQTIQRFSSQFEQTYRRYLDLVMAEAQAREARIEAALEKVRSRSLAMHRSEELKEVIQVVYDQLLQLNIHVDHAGFIIDYREKDDMHIWLADHQQGVPTEISIPYFDSPHWNSFLEAKAKGKDFFANLLSFEVKNKFYRDLFELIPDLTEEAQQAIFHKPALAISTVLLDNVGLYIEHYSETPFTAEENKTLMRFGKVFQQTYTRFLDLQKAEAQAREARIEAALERVRSRSMAMQKTEDLREVVKVLFEQMQGLSVDMGFASVSIFIFEDGSRNIRQWLPLPDGVSSLSVPYFDHPISSELFDARESGEDFFTKVYTLEEKNTWLEHGFEHTDYKDLPVAFRSSLLQAPGYAIAITLAKNSGICIPSFEGKLPSVEDIQIMKRVGKVFEQAYIRFLDLQKAEAQAREAKIEAALERVRSRSLAMHHSSELSAVVDTLLREFTNLEFTLTFCIINLIDEQDMSNTVWAANPETGKDPESYYMKFEDYPFHHAMWEAWKNQKKRFVYTLEGEEKKIYDQYLYNDTEFRRFPKNVQEANKALERYVAGFTFFKYSGLQTVSVNPISENELEILERFGRVFEQAYTRFLDLQKAEAQAKEAKIEVSLEKVRSRTMGMQSSNELPEVANLLFLEIQALGIPAWSCGYCILLEDRRSSTFIMSSEGTLQKPFLLPHYGEASFEEWDDFVQGEQTFFTQELGGNAIESHYNFMKSLPQLTPIFNAIEDAGLSLPTYQINHLCKFPQGFLLFITYEPVPDANDIFKRFTKVFDQTYTRFLDLQKAEAQAREARIEAALERIRSRTMGMQKAEELGEVATVLFGEMNTLVDNLWTCGFVLCEKNRKEDEWWLSLTNGLIEPFSLPNVGDYAHEVLYEGWEKGELYRTVTLENSKLQEHYNWLMSIPIARKIFEDMEASGIPRPNWQRLHAAYFKTGYLVIITEVPCDEEDIFKRFAQVFDLTYTRFLDLQKAESQAREAQIEAALEKVRSRSLAMQSPYELIEVAQLLREEMGALGVEELETSSIYIQDEASVLTQCWFTIKNPDNPEKSITDQMAIDLQDTWVGRMMDDFYRSTAKQTSILMQGKERIEWIRYCEEKSDLFRTSNFYGEIIPDRTYHLCKFSNGYIGAAAPGEISSESWDLLKRATAVFSFAFTRFQDLQRAEASARAAMRQASLDRIRADISSMRSASDLDRITPLIFKELTVLGVPFIRCGVFIINENQELVEAYLSSPEGNSLGVLRLPYQASELTYQAVEAWRREEIYRQHWNKEDFIQWINQLMEQDQIQDSSTYQGTAAPPESLDLHFVPFAQGMLYVGSVNPLDEKELELVQSLAKAFSIAYARFEDFVKLEQAKAEVESAMGELKATQSQLVQQEKLASLGQLTAGIAHEIKNPLNFVNNFSEVSIELVDEAIEERSKSQEARDETLVDEILEDIKSNLKKVHEHGSRANSIVTSMLQHSRGGSGKKEPTELNALIKEYVNLSFHGMRAGKNPIDVEIILDLDAEIKEVSLIKEDFTRVIINLCNNAFDAMRTVTTLHAASLRVRTKMQGDTITIGVSDNGPGIPEDIKDKILQPFFTTKKGTEGTGLGLSITHDIIKAHGGELRVESEIGKGTTFKIILNHYPSPNTI